MKTHDEQDVTCNREVEYEQTILYIHHMYETRGHIFQFAVALNTGLLGVFFQFLSANSAKLGVSVVGFLVTLAMTLMAQRSLKYLGVLEAYAIELEALLGFALVGETSKRMPKGLDSSLYLCFIYWAFVVIWAVLGAWHLYQTLLFL